ncbi:hypothetical protein VN1338_06850 [Helicobacter pylori]
MAFLRLMLDSSNATTCAFLDATTKTSISLGNFSKNRKARGIPLAPLMPKTNFMNVLYKICALELLNTFALSILLLSKFFA